jgi:hypothetical protein
VRTNVWAAWGAIIVGLIIFFVQRRRHPGLEPSAYLPGREWTPPAAVDSGETYPEFDEDDNDADPHHTSDPGAVSAVKPVTSGVGTKS